MDHSHWRAPRARRRLLAQPAARSYGDHRVAETAKTTPVGCPRSGCSDLGCTTFLKGTGFTSHALTYWLISEGVAQKPLDLSDFLCEVEVFCAA
uniref:Uncharacterized protein n=1 Tax=mine drainage metagenome TaxID=410659 RepID=E6QLG8_9ZZZZ